MGKKKAVKRGEEGGEPDGRSILPGETTRSELICDDWPRNLKSKNPRGSIPQTARVSGRPDIILFGETEGSIKGYDRNRRKTTAEEGVFA